MLQSQNDALQAEWREIENVIVDSRNTWDQSDPTRAEFEAQYWNDIPQAMYDYFDVLRDLAETIQHVTENLPCK